MKKVFKMFGIALLSCFLFFANPSVAQTNSARNTEAVSTDGMENDDDDDDWGSWGLAGLIGLIGLLGLRKRDDNIRRDSTTTRS